MATLSDSIVRVRFDVFVKLSSLTPEERRIRALELLDSSKREEIIEELGLRRLMLHEGLTNAP